MEITVPFIKPNENMEFEVTVNFWDDSKSPHFNAEVTVFIENRDRPISEVKADAIEKAKAFLLHAGSSR